MATRMIRRASKRAQAKTPSAKPRMAPQSRGGKTIPARIKRQRAGRDTKSPDTGAAPQPVPTGDAVGTNGIRVRMYRVGFGDFFLLSLKGPSGLKHILVDCGVHACDAGSIDKAVAQMAQETGRELALVIMTHRHADHISGFAKCKDVFAQFTVQQVWMSWFEDPTNGDAVKLQRNLAMVAEEMKLALAARNGPEDNELKRMAENITGTGPSLGLGAGASNAVALEVLHGGFKNKAPVAYYKAGDIATLPQDLVDAGLTVQILGPPYDLALVSQMNGKNEQYLAFNDPSLSKPVEPFDASFRMKARRYPAAAFRHRDREKVERAVIEAQPDVLAAKAKQADNTLNNQSLVVLFTFNGKRLLFVGDAQWGNWEGFLYGGTMGTPGHTILTPQSKSILAAIDFYKVGHHGSTNATPKDALDAMREGFVAMCSTQPGCYGKEKSGTEVPRGPLLDALEKKSENQLARSDQVKAGKEDATEELPKLVKPFSTPGELYIDYKL